MGDVADMMLDGTLCAGCGQSLDMEPCGYPMYCGECGDFPGAEVVIKTTIDIQKPAAQNPAACPDCNKRFKNGYALGAHWDAKHGS